MDEETENFITRTFVRKNTPEERIEELEEKMEKLEKQVGTLNMLVGSLIGIGIVYALFSVF